MLHVIQQGLSPRRVPEHLARPYHAGVGRGVCAPRFRLYACKQHVDLRYRHEQYRAVQACTKGASIHFGSTHTSVRLTCGVDTACERLLPTYHTGVGCGVGTSGF